METKTPNRVRKGIKRETRLISCRSTCGEKNSKRHPFSFNCAQAFSLILRQPHDHGENRKESTPDPETINKQLDEFVLTWKDVAYQDKSVLTLDALKEIKNLREHINRGCLSNIPPGCGTERNENLHKCIRKSASKVRIGVHLAVALFTTFLYVWNEKRKSADLTGKKTKFLPIFDNIDNSTSPCRSTMSCSRETFGVGVSSERRINSTDEKLPPSYGNLFSDCDWDANELDLDEIINLSEFKIGSEDVKKILDRASNIMSVTELLESCNGRNRTFNTEHANLMSNPALFAIGTCIDKIVEEKESLERLQNTLASYNMELVNSPSDGDCLLTSVIFGLKQMVSSGKYEKYNDHLENLNLCLDSDIDFIVLHLRKLLVSEWLENASQYEDFITGQEISFEELATSYTERGVFAGELGNIMAVGLANVLRINLVLFTSMEKMKTIPIVPREKVLCNGAIYLAFNNFGCGHYDAVVKSAKHAVNTEELHSTETKTTEHEKQERKGCRCGRGAARQNKDKKFCFQVPGERRSQCLCLRDMKKCSSACSCFNCNNPYEASSDITTQTSTSTKRIRGKQSLQGLRKTSLEYMLQCGEKPKDPTWNRMEKYVLQSLANHLVENGEFTNETDLTSSYNELVDLVNEIPGVNLLLHKKNKKVVQQMMKKTTQQAELFRQLYLQQVEDNLGTE